MSFRFPIKNDGSFLEMMLKMQQDQGIVPQATSSPKGKKRSQEDEAERTRKGGVGRHRYDNDNDDHVQQLLQRYSSKDKMDVVKDADNLESERQAKRRKMGHTTLDHTEYVLWKNLSEFEDSNSGVASFVEYMCNKLLSEWHAESWPTGMVKVQKYEQEEMLAERKKAEAVMDSVPGLFALLRKETFSYRIKSILEGLAENLCNRDYTECYTLHLQLTEGEWLDQKEAVPEHLKQKHLKNLKAIIDYGLRKYPNARKCKNNYVDITIKGVVPPKERKVDDDDDGEDVDSFQG